MKEIECPACEERIPADSRYCDMCGAELLECVNCGTLGTDPFCPECGQAMIARKVSPIPAESTTGQTGENEPGKDLNNRTAEDDDNDKTKGTARQKQIVLKSKSGNIVLKPENGAVIGRKDGPYTVQLADLNMISRSHGKFVHRGGEWYIVDFGSTNGTYVNDREVPANTPVKISVGDSVDIGTYVFTVEER